MEHVSAAHFCPVFLFTLIIGAGELRQWSAVHQWTVNFRTRQPILSAVCSRVVNAPANFENFVILNYSNKYLGNLIFNDKLALLIIALTACSRSVNSDELVGSAGCIQHSHLRHRQLPSSQATQKVQWLCCFVAHGKLPI